MFLPGNYKEAEEVFLQIQNDKIQVSLSFLQFMSWPCRPNPEDQINRKPDDQKNDQMTENQKTISPKVLF